MNKLRLRAERMVFANRIDLLAMTDDGHIGRPLTMEPHEIGLMHGAPTLSLEISQAQELMDDLWRAGLRPSEGAGSAGALAATKSHLDDMRKITFHQLQIDQGTK